MDHQSGIPLGGIGTGSIEIRPDGYFHEWQIFNRGSWALEPGEATPPDGPMPGPGTLAFYLRCQAGEGPLRVRRLGLRSDQHDLYHLPWLKSVRAIEFEGRYPTARLSYVDPSLPVSASALAFSPIIPHEARLSATPGFYVSFTFENCSQEPLDVSLLSVLENPLVADGALRPMAITVTESDPTTHITLRMEAGSPDDSLAGSLCLSASGEHVSWISGASRAFMRGFKHRPSAFVRAHQCVHHRFRREGHLPNLGAAKPPPALPREDEITAMDEPAQRTLLTELLQLPSFNDFYRHLTEVEPDLVEIPEGRLSLLRDGLILVGNLDLESRGWGDTALCSSLRLAPGEKRDVLVTLSWHFPHHLSPSGRAIGHRYEDWFADALEVSQFLTKNWDNLSRHTCAFSEALYDTTLDPVLPEAWAGQLSTLAKATWWAKDGSFGVWEGLGCCGLNTTDVSYHGSFPLLTLFPYLERQQLESLAKLQTEDGRIPHAFFPDLSTVDDQFTRVDMNPQFVLLACRHYLWTGDVDFLRRCWPHVVKAMDQTATLDRNGDGLPDHGTALNTYDQWDFFGTPAYISSLWIAALQAGIRMAEDLGDTVRAGAWRALTGTASESFDRMLWNGEYYRLWVDNAGARDECCMTDQISGEGFSRLIGLEPNLPDERVTAALGAIFRHNFTPEGGLLNAVYPPSQPRRFPAYGNFQADAPWSGIEYVTAATLLELGLCEEGLAVVRSVHERYLSAGRHWNHVECGDHYYRAMASWWLLLASTGFKLDQPRQQLTFSPMSLDRDFRAPWFTPTGWGILRQTPDAFELSCRSGFVSFARLCIPIPAVPKSVRVGGREISHTAISTNRHMAIAFDEALILESGTVLEVT